MPLSPAAGTACHEPSVVRSAPMRKIASWIPKIARGESPVLIHGEAGVGKATIAREIHRQSTDGTAPLCWLVCGALREAELEKKLFAVIRDCFSRPARETRGSAESAQRGTLVLDGVTRLPKWAQVKLYDLLRQSERAVPLATGGTPAAARLIVTARSDRESPLADEAFYPALYYYLNALEIHVPALRHRQEDILPLAEYFLARADSSHHGLPRHFSTEARQRLLRHPWPDNVQQLASVVTRAAALADGPQIGEQAVLRCLGKTPDGSASETVSIPLTGGLKAMETVLIEEVIRRCRGNKSAAARTLGLHRRTLYRLLR